MIEVSSASYYDEADGALLILGEPGSGKTTLLLELARDLLDRAEQDETHRMPVVFNLSSWAVKQQPSSMLRVDSRQPDCLLPTGIAPCCLQWTSGCPGGYSRDYSIGWGA